MMTLREVEDKYAVPVSTSAGWIHRGELRARKVQGRWVVREADLFGRCRAFCVWFDRLLSAWSPA